MNDIEREQRETDIQTLCKRVLEMWRRENYNPNGPDYDHCAFCYEDDRRKTDITHTPDCVVFIAKDLTAGMECAK